MACLLLVLVLLRSFVPIGNKILALALSLIFGILFTVQLSSVILTGNIADYRFYENFSLKDATSVSDFFGTELLFIILALLLATLLIHFLGKVVRTQLANKIIPIGLLLAGFVIMGFNGGILNNAYDTLKLKFAGSASFEEALKSLDINPDDYVLKNAIEIDKSSKKKNVVVICLESFEKDYLENDLKELTPNLTRLVQSNTFYELNPSTGSDWTSASIYTMVTGMPGYFGIDGNSAFQNNYQNKLTTIADVFKEYDYDLEYFIGKKEFSGIDDMLSTLGFVVKSEKDFETRYESVPWGIHDKDLFKEFKKELLIKKDSRRPFGLFLSTISTHFPNGTYDARMAKIVGEKNSELETMIAATDYLIGDLISFLEKENMLSETVFYIFPDHLFMGKPPILDKNSERSLFLLTNAKKQNFEFPKDEIISQIDIPKIILQGAELKHNAKFLTDFIEFEDKNSFLIKNMKQLTQLNNSALQSIVCDEGFSIEVTDEGFGFEIKNDDGLLCFSSNIPEDKFCRRVIFDNQMRAYDSFEIPFEKIAYRRTPKTNYLDLYMSKGILYAALKGPLGFALTKKDKRHLTFKKTDVELLEKILEAKTADNIVLSSNGYHTLRNSYFKLKDKKEIIGRGLTIICLNNFTDYEFKTFDTYQESDEVNEFIKTLKTLLKNKVPFLILVHDSAAKKLNAVAKELKLMGFNKLAKLKHQEAYIMHNLNGTINEEIDAASIHKVLDYPIDVQNTERYLSRPVEEYLESNDRFIAHAGGELNGIKYTNTKEALDSSYAKGFRYFELDIIETSDGKFVASHDWGHWSKQTNYKEDVPVTLTEFKKHKIYGKYSSLDIKGINQWFAEHPDAILITDKTNKPLTFANQFVDKERLMMELFTHDSLESAIRNGIEGIISTVPLSQIKGDKITYLKNKNVKFVAIPRTNIPAQKKLLNQLRRNNIKVYVYQVNVEPGKDEKYVLENEIGIVYGMYADNWIFDPEPR